MVTFADFLPEADLIVIVALPTFFGMMLPFLSTLTTNADFLSSVYVTYSLV